jgi:rieske iron-sulfur protein
MVQACAGCSRVGEPRQRRVVLKVALGIVLGLKFVDSVATQEVDPRDARPQDGDQLVFADGDRQGQLITPEDPPLGGPQVRAFPVDPHSKVVRDGSRLNKVLVVRFDPDQLGEESRDRAVNGVVAYSAICTHQGCEATAWDAEAKILWCPCHDSKYDLRDNGHVVSGPARRRLAALPLRLADGVLTVVGGFTGPVGPKTR